MNYELTLIPQSLGGIAEKAAAMGYDKETGHYVLNIRFPVAAGAWQAAKSARFTYRVIGTKTLAVTDTVEIKK